MFYLERFVLSSSKKKNFFTKFLIGLGKFFVVIFCILLIWILFSIFNTKSRLSVIPNDYSAYIQTDSLWKTLDPVIDLRVMDILLSSKEFSSLRGAFIDFRKSSLRKNPLVSFCANRKVSAGYYSATGSYVLVVDMGWLSSITRLSKFIIPNLKIENLEYIDLDDFYYFTYGEGESKFYIKPVRNLLVITPSYSSLLKAFETDFYKNYNKDTLSLIKQKTGSEIKIFVNSNKLISELDLNNNLIKNASEFIEPEQLSMVSFSLTDSDVKIKGEIPLISLDENLSLPKASVPSLISRIPNIVQYYTVINTGDIEKLKQNILPLVTEKGKTSPWEKAQPLCKSLFNLSLEDLLCSWTGKEFALLGIEGLNDPVFAIQISDEKRRQEIFNKVLSSIILRDDTSLILDGVRLPKIMLPGFLEGLLSILNINLPNPYYMVLDNYIYFSQSPEPLSAIFTSTNDNKRITRNPNWIAVSEKQKNETSLSLFYDLERSIPFFLQNKSQISTILNLYSVGLFNLRKEKSAVGFELHACTRKAGNLREVPGFPIDLQGKTDYKLYSEFNKKSNHIFWLENGINIKSLDVSSLKISNFEMENEGWIISDRNTKTDKALWALTKSGVVYSLNKDLDYDKTYSYVTGKIPSNPPSLYKDGIIFTTNDNYLCFVNDKSEYSEVKIPCKTSIKAACTVIGNTIILYEKGFKGKIYIFEDKKLVNQNKPLELSGIAFGSPALIKKNDKNYISMVTQSGLLYLWENDKLVSGFPMELDSTFYSNFVSNGNYFFGLSDNGQIFRLSTEGRVLSVIIPNCSTKNGYIFTESPEQNDIVNVYIGVDGNLIYCFNEKLELMAGYPLAGCGKPAFADINGDHYADTFVLTLDNKLNAWNLR